MKYEDYMMPHLPEGSSVGPWTIKKRTAPEKPDYETLRLERQGRGLVLGRTYTMLVHERRGIVMSDTPAEIRDHAAVLDELQKLEGGEVLIHGLGMGMVLQAAMKNKKIEWIHVVEIDKDVIELYWKNAPTDDVRLRIRHADALTYVMPPGRFAVVWHDIWDSICADNLPAMHRLHRRYGKRADWQGSWCRHLCERWR